MKKLYKISLIIGLITLITSGITKAQYPFWSWLGGLNTTNNSGTYPSAVGLSDNNAYPAARIGGTAQFKDGKLYIFGGHNSTTNRFADLWSYEVSSKKWTLLNSASNTYADTADPYGVSKTPNSNTRPGGRSGVNSVLVGDNIYIFGGQGYSENGSSLGSGKLRDFWKYSITNNTWTLLRGGLANSGTDVIGTKGATDDGTFTPRSRSNGMLATVGTAIYLFGGEGSSVTGDLWKWDTTTSKWLWLTGNNGATSLVNIGVDDATNTPSARQGAAFVAIETKIYLFGGTTSGNTETNMQNDLWVYNTTTGFWNLINPANTAPAIRKDVQGWTADGKLYVFGGVSRADGSTSKVTNDLWEYNPATNKWTKLKGDDAPSGTFSDGDYNSASSAPQITQTTTPTGRVGILAAADGKKLYLFGGDRTTGWTQRYNDLWLMDLDVTVLPVSLLNFSSKATTQGVQLTWKVASETNHKQYIVSRSTDGVNFSVIGTTTAHSYLDNTVSSGTYYYQLAQEDNDGKSSKLATSVVKIGLTANTVVFPNPSKGKITVNVDAGAYQTYTVSGLQGNTIASGTIAKEATAINIDLTKTAKGTYIIRLSGANGNSTSKVVKL